MDEVNQINQEATQSTENSQTQATSTGRARFRAPAQQNSSVRRPGTSRYNNPRTGGNSLNAKRSRFEKKNREDEDDNIESQVIEVKRVTRVVKGGKRMRFAALVVVGNKQGLVGFGFKKGLDYQESVAKATRKAKENMIQISLNDANSIKYPVKVKHKSAVVFLKPANSGTGLISGGFLRPVLELAGVQNIYSKVLGSNNKITGVQAAIKALQKYEK